MKSIKNSILVIVFMLIAVPQILAEDSPALEAAKGAAAQPSTAPVAAPEAKSSATPEVASPAVPSPPPVEPAILKQLREHASIPVRSSLDQAIDANGNRTLEYEEIKEYIKTVRSSIAKEGKYPTNTDVLYHFDKNHDGFMDSGEVSALDSYIH
ncbi:MAG: hypothetical protein JNN05_00880 [Candidatus Omnitrophica bacterium]|nr:hypothetical protein [Candidatus Omnitrophota bacterium]